jgi:uncharacterized membrane protein
MMMMGFWLIVPLILLCGGVYAFGWRPRFNQARPAHTSESPLEILKARYARGEITGEEYNLVRLDLES